MRARLFTAFLALTASFALGADNPPASATIDTNGLRKPISPQIYGLNFASPTQLVDLNAPLNRNGGNTSTRYNWQQNASNHARDWYFQSLPAGPPTPGADKDAFIAGTKASGSEPIITIPLIGWVAKDNVRRCSFSIALYGPQQDNDWEWFPDCGNGVRPDGVTLLRPDAVNPADRNDPTDANVQVGSLFQKAWIEHLVTTWGAAGAGGVRYYGMDNEPALWFDTHRDVAPVGETMEGYRDKVIDYGAQIKNADPGAVLLAPEEWGWLGVLYSGYDLQWLEENNAWGTVPPDSAAHGNMSYFPWFLQEMKKNYSREGRRLLDVATVHYYPQSGEFSDNVTSAMQLLRNRSTRSLWDPAYTDESWIATQVRFIPRLKEWVNTYFPNTPIGITEYNWGAEGHMSGATAQADLLGIFGREGLDYATRWTTPATGTPAYRAFRMYRNYDGANSTFGDINVPLTGPDPDNVAMFAALRSTDGALTVMVISKYLADNTPLTLDLGAFAHGGTAKVFRLTVPDLGPVPDLNFGGSGFSAVLPPQSITMYVIAPANVRPAPTIASLSPSVMPPAGNEVITVSGTNFEPLSRVWIEGAELATVYVSPTTLQFTAPARPAGTLTDVTVKNVNTLTATLTGGLYSRFTDVVAGSLFDTHVEKIFRRGVTLGCGPGLFCHNGTVTRAQMAIFLLRGMYPRDWTALPATGVRFTDVAASYWAAPWIEQLAYAGVTQGCTPTTFCPENQVARAEMAIFLLRAKHGSSYVPPPAQGNVFTDVPATYWAAAWIEQLYAEGITGGCGGGRYCPGQFVTRGQMSAFLARTFGL